MSQTPILIPAAILALWTLLVLLLIPFRRFQAAFAGEVTADDFRFGESGRVSDKVSLPNRSYMNLLEAPVLFYVLCLAMYVTEHLSPLSLKLAWAYVGLRVMHSVVHLSYNNVIHRLSLFALSNLVLVALWLMLLMRLLGEQNVQG